MSFDLTIGKSFNILNNRANLNVFASVKSILNNHDITIASNESNGIYANSRLGYADKYAYTRQSGHFKPAPEDVNIGQLITNSYRLKEYLYKTRLCF